MVRTAPKLLNAEEMKVRTPKWIWHPYIPAGCATMLFGVGGIGKSYMAVEIAAALSSGRPLPGQKKEDAKEYKILLMSAEDSPSVVIKPRLIKCRAKLENIYIPDAPFTLDKWGLNVIKQYLKTTGANIVIIDPIVHYMGGKVDMNKMNEVREVTGALHQSAMASNCAIMIIHHARKGGEGQTYEQAAGSADFVNSVRSVLFAHNSNDGTAVMEHVKTNYGVFGPALAFLIDDDGFTWVGHYSESMLKHGGSSRMENAKVFLAETLRNGPVSSKVLGKMAKDEGFTMTTLNRAKPSIAESIMRQIVDERIWFWRLKGDKTEPMGCIQRKPVDAKKASKDFLISRGQWKDPDAMPISGTTVPAKVKVA